jgi:hypothetical protein
MRRIASLLTIALLSIASRAEAADHGMRVTEIYLSDGTAGNAQYIELTDGTADEPFSQDPYGVQVYDADGNVVGSTTFDVAAGTRSLWIATADADAAFSATADVTLTVQLPTDGQVCFTRSNNASRIHCVAWGCINTAVTGGVTPTGRGASPPATMALLRNGSGTWYVGTPSPEMANTPGVPGDFCATEPDAGVATPPPDASVPDANPDEPPDANPSGGDDDDDGGGGGGGGCCRVGGGDAGGAMLLALATMLLVRRRRA